MWWQILPSFAIITGVAMIPNITTVLTAYYSYGSIHGREMDTGFQRYRFYRDKRIVGRELWDQHRHLGLDELSED